MCGIVVGLSFGNKLSKKDEEVRQKLLRYFVTELMIATEDRGKDATGAVVLFNDGRYAGIKRGDRVTEWLAKFSETKDYWGSFLKIWRENEVPSRIVMGHCRQGTHGDKEDNSNNHPIKIGNIVGIHNGQIRNHEIIFENLGCKRDGKVDSEAIFRIFDHLSNGGKEPFTIDMCQEVVRRLDGEFAVVAFNADNLDQVPVFRDRRPVEFVLLKKYGILLMISEHKFWTQVHFAYERLINYNPDMFGIKKMPSFLDKGEVESKELPDDHCMLFDLTKVVSMDTKIDDLGESKRMERANKIWDTRFARSYQRTAYNTSTAAETTGAHTTSSTVTRTTHGDDSKRRWVWDKAHKKYLVKIGDIFVSDEDELVIDAKDVTVVAGDDKNTEANDVILVDEDDQQIVTMIPSKSDAGDTEPLEEPTSFAPAIEDSTDYSIPITAGSEDTQASDDNTEAGKVVEVNMKTVPAEILEAARQAYEALPSNVRGFSSVEELLTDLHIKDKEAADNLGMVILSNRVAAHSWKQGYASCVMDLMGKPADNSKEKDDKREKHITALKSFVLILAKFFNETKKGSGAHSTPTATLASTVLEGNKTVKATDLLPLFNVHERGVIAEVSRIISQADQYKQG